MARPLWFSNLIKHAFPGRFLAARITRVPIVGRLIDHAFFAGDNLVYLPRDRTIQINERIEAQTDMVLPSQVVEHFVEQANYHWIMNECICRDALTCEDYPIGLGCLFLGEAVLGINSQMGRRVTKSEALEHVQRCREAGLVHMVGRTKVDSIWLGANPHHKLLTVCNCCPCCCIMRVLPNLAPAISEKITRMPGVTVAVSEWCAGCGTCTDDTCFVDAIQMNGSQAVIGDACRGCGHCVSVCPQEAIEVEIDDERFVDRTIAHLSPLVDVT
jgi:ferredoxin